MKDNLCKDLLGRSLRDVRISVIDRCNFRCKYCMPEDTFNQKYPFLKRNDMLSFQEIIRLVHVFAEFGVRKVRITGGEPLLRKSLPSLIKEISKVPGIDDLGMISNGYYLPRYAKELKASGLQRITLSLDSLDEKVFHFMNGGKSTLDKVLKGLEVAEKAGFKTIKINAVIQRNVNDHNILDLAKYFKGTGHILRFIEYMDVGTLNKWKENDVLTGEEILQKIDLVYPLEPLPPNYLGEVATRYRYKDGSGEIAVISSVSKPFCSSCTRIRLSADGKLFTCLFAKEGLDMKKYLRSGISDKELLEKLSQVWEGRQDQYSQERSLSQKNSNQKVEMYHIGG
jgi:GTP 3',8-cyclase